MSGGHFDYKQYYIEDIIREINLLIRKNGKTGDYGLGYNFSPEIIHKFREGIQYLTLGQIYAHRIDYLVSGDDSEDTFRKKLAEETESVTDPRHISTNAEVKDE